jgi:hypothetical protein
MHSGGLREVCSGKETIHNYCMSIIMKRQFFDSFSLLFTVSLMGIITVGCNDYGLVETDAVETTQSPRFILMPKNLALQKPLWIVESVTVEDGGILKLKYVETDSSKPKDKLFELQIEIKFHKRSVSEDFIAGLGVDAHYLMSDLSLEFGPHGTSFLKPAELNIKVKGLDLSDYAKGEKFRLYYTSDGKWEEMRAKVSVNIEKGELDCKDGKLPHFSRYAFGRIPGS